ncbi:MAG: ATPase, T2SS/T4P/T4SS family, partial [Nitriliruptor sp.]|uniref:ATPase, T2SS/T4P/T4SS family n=1 Tax=Nitriliruptor sp. TaxID=2448056 RepID=UPI0034A07911
ESAYRKPYGMILVTGPTGSGKALTLDTPVPTPAGMSTMGALNEGDEVFGRDGRPCRVVRVWPVNDHPELYRVHFSDGQQVVADRDHQWLVADHWGRNAPRTPKRRAAVAAYEQAHADADRLEELADTWDGAGSLRLAALTALVDTNVVGDHFPSAYAVRQALKAVDCPFTGGNGPVPQQFPTAVALKSLALRLRQRYSTQPVDQTPLYRMTTSEMVAAGFRTRAGQAQFAVPAPAALQLPPADLLVDPYLIGYWLGDGSTGGGRITVGDPYVNRDLASDLRDIGVIGVKHIPLAYSRGSYEQRLALLQGLMDSDGTVDDGDGGSCELTLSDRRLADDALALIRSLGIAASMVADAPASYRNDDGGKVEAGRRHRIHFTPHIEVFQLPRKRDRQTDRVARGPSEISRWRHVTDIEVVATDDPAYGPARCITVDSCDRTYLCGEGFVPTSNTTSLYATLNVLNQPGVNLITTEDPVEYQLPGINQVQVNNKVGLSFARALRSILRQDPDIILVGEMRDRETAQIGVEAALTGHLVLSTLHTNDAPSAVVRLTEMGIEPFLVGSAVDCVLAQRLARRVCNKCVEMYSPEAEILKAAGFDDETVEARPEVPRAVGCTSCSGTGYRGRLAIHEVMLVSEEIERMAVSRASSEDIGRVAVEQGMRPLREDGLAKVLLGRTTIEEVGRVVT